MKKLPFVIVLLSWVFVEGCGKKTEETRPVRRDVTETVFASGYLEAQNSYSLTAQTDGYLLAVRFEEGDVVESGALLALVDGEENRINAESAAALSAIAKSNTLPSAPLLSQAENAVEIARRKRDQDAVQERRYRELWQSNSIPKVDYENALLQYQTSDANYRSALASYKNQQQQARQQLISEQALANINQVVERKNQVRAVLGGKVYKKYKQAGDYVRRGDVIADIGNAQTIYAKVSVDESVMAKVKLGQKADVQLNTDKNKVYRATVREIAPSFDEATQSFICKLYFDTPLDFQIARTQLQCNIIVGQVKKALLIPRHYMDYGGFVQVKGEATKRKIKTGFTSNNWVQVESGIDESTVLVTDNLPANNTATSEVGAQFK